MVWLTILLAMVGKISITVSYGTVYIFSAEQFPTVVRNAGLGASSTFARLGSILAPYINLMVSKVSNCLILILCKFSILFYLNTIILVVLRLTTFWRGFGRNRRIAINYAKTTIPSKRSSPDSSASVMMLT